MTSILHCKESYGETLFPEIVCPSASDINYDDPTAGVTSDMCSILERHTRRADILKNICARMDGVLQICAGYINQWPSPTLEGFTTFCFGCLTAVRFQT